MSSFPLKREDAISTEAILDAARSQVRRFGETKTNVIDIARALGTSHTTIYRHFRSKADVFDAVVQAAMRDEEELALRFVDSVDSPTDRLLGLVLALHQRKRERCNDDPEVFQLYRRVVEERPEIVQAYAAAITQIAASILADGVRQNMYVIDDIDAAAAVVRDAVTVFVHPAHVEAAIRAGLHLEPMIGRLIATLDAAFRSGVTLAGP